MVSRARQEWLQPMAPVSFKLHPFSQVRQAVRYAEHQCLVMLFHRSTDRNNITTASWPLGALNLSSGQIRMHVPENTLSNQNISRDFCVNAHKVHGSLQAQAKHQPHSCPSHMPDSIATRVLDPSRRQQSQSNTVPHAINDMHSPTVQPVYYCRLWSRQEGSTRESTGPCPRQPRLRCCSGGRPRGWSQPGRSSRDGRGRRR